VLSGDGAAVNRFNGFNGRVRDLAIVHKSTASKPLKRLTPPSSTITQVKQGVNETRGSGEKTEMRTLLCEVLACEFTSYLNNCSL